MRFGYAVLDRRQFFDLTDSWLALTVQCLPVLSELPFLLEEETTWEAPDVEDECEGMLSSLFMPRFLSYIFLFPLSTAQSFDQVLSAALSSLPRDSTIDIISSFNDLSSAFSAHVKAIAEQGRAIEKRDVEEFFEAWKERKRKGRP
jgi:E3 ubiquitin-protein ligase UBR7